jgi:hypothetical protein
MYGGQPAGAEWRLHAGCLPAGWVCVVTTNPVAAAGHPLPPNFVEAGAAAYTPDLVRADDAAEAAAADASGQCDALERCCTAGGALRAHPAGALPAVHLSSTCRQYKPRAQPDAARA